MHEGPDLDKLDRHPSGDDASVEDFGQPGGSNGQGGTKPLSASLEYPPVGGLKFRIVGLASLPQSVSDQGEAIAKMRQRPSDRVRPRRNGIVVPTWRA